MKIVEISADYIGGYGTDLTVVNAARVSMDKVSEWELTLVDGAYLSKLRDQDFRLINYLHKHKHHSPFNHAFLSFRCKAPIFVARQLVKHKFMPWNEVSRRYVDSEPEFYFPEYWRKRADNVKQGSLEEQAREISIADKNFTQLAFRRYRQLLDEGIAPEEARMVLPLNTMTEWIWSGTLGAFLDMLVLRLDKHSQYESRIVAKQIYEQVKELFPVSAEVYLGEINN